MGAGYIDDKALIIGKTTSSQTWKSGSAGKREGTHRNKIRNKVLGGYKRHREGSNSFWGDQESLPRGGDFEVALKGELGFGS